MEAILKRLSGFLLLFMVFGMTAGKHADSQVLETAQVDYLKQGIEAYQQGSYEEAEQTLTKARSIKPSSALTAYYLGMTMKKMQNYADALNHLKDAVKLQPAVQEAFLEIADIYYATDKPDEALHAVEVAENIRIQPAQTAFLKGLILSKKKKYEDALASFESAKSMDQKIAPTATYQIGMIFLRTGRVAHAKDLFRALAAEEPNTDIGTLAQEQVDTIAAGEESKQKRFRSVAGIQLQYDSNVVLKPNGVPVDISGESDMSAVVTLQSEYALPVNEPVDLKLQYSLYWNSHTDLKDFDVQSHILGGTADYRFGDKSLSFLANYNYTLVSNETYMNIVTLSPTLGLIPMENNRFFLSLLYQIKDYTVVEGLPADENRNAANTGAGVAWFAPMGPGGSFSVRYDINLEDADGANWSYAGNKLSGGIQYPISEKIKIGGNLEINIQAFDNVHSTFQQKRKDTTYTTGFQLTYPVSKNIEAQFMYSYTKADSTIAVYSFDKNIAGIGLSAAF